MKRAHRIVGRSKRKYLKKIINEVVISVTVDVPNEGRSDSIISCTPYELYLISKYGGDYEEMIGLVSLKGNPAWLKIGVKWNG